MFLAVTPGFVIGRLRYMSGLGREIDTFYGDVQPDFEQLKSRGVRPFEVPALVAEASLAVARLLDWYENRHAPGAGRKLLSTVLDLLGGPATFVVVLVLLPTVAQGFAAFWWIREAEGAAADALICLGVLFIMMFTFANVAGAGWRWLSDERQRLSA